MNPTDPADVPELLDAVRELLEQLRADPRGQIISFSEAVRRVPLRDSKARRWLRREGLVSEIEGREVVCWDAVLEHLRPPGLDRAPPKPTKKKPTTKKAPAAPAVVLPSAGLFQG